MTRATYRAWKCRNGVHRWGRGACRDCRAPLVIATQRQASLMHMLVERAIASRGMAGAARVSSVLNSGFHQGGVVIVRIVSRHMHKDKLWAGTVVVLGGETPMAMAAKAENAASRFIDSGRMAGFFAAQGDTP